MEIWRDITGYDGDYQVSNLGRVKSLKKQVGRKDSERIMAQSTSWQGYKRVVLTKNGKSKIFAVHRLVAQEFIPNKEQKPIIDHINGDRADNRMENLIWCTYSENSRNYIEREKPIRYNSIKVKDSLGNVFSSYREAGRYWGLCPNTIKNDCTKQVTENNSKRRKVRFSWIGGE